MSKKPKKSKDRTVNNRAKPVRTSLYRHDRQQHLEHPVGTMIADGSNMHQACLRP